MAESSLSSRQPIRSQVLHSGLAECQPVQTTEASTRGRTDSMNPARFPAGSSSDAMVTNAQRRRSPGRPLTREEQQQELVRNFQRRYKIDPVPTMTQFKLSSIVAGYRVSADVCKPRRKSPYVSLGVKMGEDPMFVKKVVVTPQHSDVRMFTPAMEMGILRLQFALGYDWQKRSFGVSWRCKTKWTRGPKLQRSFKHYTNNNMEVTSFWNLRSELPTLGGQLGANAMSFQTDIGRLLVDLDRMKVAVKL